jgi:hypothetical protein
MTDKSIHRYRWGGNMFSTGIQSIDIMPLAILRSFKLRNFSYLRSEVKKTDIKDFDGFPPPTPPPPFPEWKRNEREVAVENCWAMTQATGWSWNDQSSCTVSEPVCQLDCLIHKYKFEHTWFKPGQSSICAMQSANYVQFQGLVILQNFLVT